MSNGKTTIEAAREEIDKYIEMIAMITDGPIISENITIDQHYNFLQIIKAKDKEIQKLRDALEEVNHILNWNADHVCICYGYNKNIRYKKCQYHQIMNVLNREALKEGG